jgi:hypothetical protein
MRRFVVLALLLITATPALARKQKPPPPKPTCEKTTERFSARQAEWDAFTQKAFADALTREQLTTPKMLQRDMSPQDKLLDGVRPGATFEIAKQQALYLRTQQGYGGANAEFVQDAQGVIHPLVRKESQVGIETHTLCGCGPMGGGAVPPMVAIVYMLPDGATYDGTPIELAYDAKHIEIRWRNVVDGKDVMCQPPP